MNLRQLTIKDQLELKKVYFDSIQSLDEKLYSREQKRAWSSQAWNNPNFDKSITHGKGWLLSEKGMIIAFLLRSHPFPLVIDLSKFGLFQAWLDLSLIHI